MAGLHLLSWMELSVNLIDMTSLPDDLRGPSNYKIHAEFLLPYIPCQWNFQHNTPFYYIPIIDNRRIIPPTPYSPWSEKNIIQIIHGREFSCISHDTFEQIKHEQVRANKVGLVFQMHVDGNDYAFCCMVTFKNGTMTSLLEKLTHSITTIEIVQSKRADFAHLCRSIGNDASIADQRVLLIGCGSLGSYLAEDLVKVGFRSLDIYDNETLSNENILRHRLDGFWIGHFKTSAMKAELEMIHPEVCINAFNVRMDESQLARVADDFDLVIFTVGSSDVQLSLNRLFVKKHFAKPVIFTWLEAGGVYSHKYMVPETIGYDIVDSSKQLNQYADQIISDIAAIEKAANISSIKICVAASSAFIFGLGTKFSKTQDKDIIIYHFQNSAYPWGINVTRKCPAIVGIKAEL